MPTACLKDEVIMKYPVRQFFLSFIAASSVGITACGTDEQSVKQSEPASYPKQSADEKAKVVQPAVHADSSANVSNPDSEPTIKVASGLLSVQEGKKRYEQTCKVCHDQGLLDAPKLSDKATWARRLDKGVEVLYQHAAKGFNKMPAQAVGTASEEEVRAAVDYMIEQIK